MILKLNDVNVNRRLGFSLSILTHKKKQIIFLLFKFYKYGRYISQFVYLELNFCNFGKTIFALQEKEYRTSVYVTNKTKKISKSITLTKTLILE